MKPVVRDFTAYVVEERGEIIRFAHRTGQGSAGKTAFVDTGAKVEVTDWRNREATLAAMQLAANKWKEGLAVQGPAQYQQMVVELAAEHGIRIANPELQQRLKTERQRVVIQRETSPGFAQAAVVNQTVDPPVRTEFERNLELDRISTQVQAEAARETQQANVARALGETPIDPDYRSQQEAAEARQNERTIEGNPRQQMPTTTSDSPRMQWLGDEQRKVLREDAQAQGVEVEKLKSQPEKPRGQKM